MAQKILIVDASPDIRVVGSFLQSIGYEVHEAKTGSEAIQTAVAEGPALILLDLRLPDKGGLDTANALRSFPETRNIPIIGWTVDPASKPSQEQLQRVGFVACLEKPVSLIALHSFVQRFIPK